MAYPEASVSGLNGASWLDQNGGGCYKLLELFEGPLFFFGPSPELSLLGELVEGFGDV